MYEFYYLFINKIFIKYKKYTYIYVFIYVICIEIYKILLIYMHIYMYEFYFFILFSLHPNPPIETASNQHIQQWDSFSPSVFWSMYWLIYKEYCKVYLSSEAFPQVGQYKKRVYGYTEYGIIAVQMGLMNRTE